MSTSPAEIRRGTNRVALPDACALFLIVWLLGDQIGQRQQVQTIAASSEYGHGSIVPGTVYVQFCWDSPNGGVSWHAQSEQFARASYQSTDGGGRPYQRASSASSADYPPRHAQRP